MSVPKIVPVASLSPAAYNPREVKPERLELVALSLAKLGWVLPIYADENGEILSGHQRHFAATEMLGANFVPVVFTPKLAMNKRQAVNLLFNRATNDYKHEDDSEDLAHALLSSDIPERARALPDLAIDTDEWFPIMAARDVAVLDLLDANPLWTDKQGVMMTQSLRRQAKIDVMPIVATPSLRVVNGQARLAALGKEGAETIPVVTIPEEIAEVAYGLLNLLSMRYDVENALADDLRHNANRAMMTGRRVLAVCMRFDLSTRPQKGENFLDWTNPAHAARWISHYGSTVADFGAGRLIDTKRMREMGATVHAFEPFYSRSIEAARELARAFLDSVEANVHYDSVFLSSVMNSVPFRADRVKVIQVLAALAVGHPGTMVYATGRGSQELDVASAGEVPSRIKTRERIQVDFEPGVLVSRLAEGRPMLQKLHSQGEFADEFRTAFDRVEIGKCAGSPTAVCSQPKPIDPAWLAECLRFEFDLRWPGENDSMGLAERALEAFGTRLGLDLLNEPVLIS